MEVATTLPLQGAYKQSGGRSRVLSCAPSDPVGKSLGANLLAERVCADSIGHPVEGGLAALAELRVLTRSSIGQAGPWAGTLLFTPR